MKINFKAIGYYICEINDTPEWLQGISRQILPVSGCIGEQHPRWECGIGGFHSFLCNSLQKELPEARFNDVGLLSNVFQEAEEFARQIEGKGEPVEWIPCRIGMHGQTAEFDRLTGGGRWERQDSPHGQSVF